MKNRVCEWMLAVVVSFLCASCGGSGNSDTTSQIRLVNVTRAASLSLDSTGTGNDAKSHVQISGVATNSASTYKTVNAGTYTVSVNAADASLVASTQSLGLTGTIKYTMLAYQRDGAIETFTLTDNQVAPSSGFVSFTLANASRDAGPLDIYVVPPGTTTASLTSLSPTFTDLIPSAISIAQSVAAGTYDIIITGTGNPNDVRLTLPSISLTSTEIVTLALTSTSGGALVEGSLIQQGGTVQFFPATNSRVRVVSGFPANGGGNSAVATSVGSTTLPISTSPSVGTYKLVPGGTSTYTVTVDGVAPATLPPATFAVGGDYTILVYGVASTPSVTVLSDDNQTASGNANIRLVNAAVSTSTLTLEDNFVPVDDEVAYGTASPYTGATASSGSLLQLSSPSATFTPPAPLNVNIQAGSVYTLFVLGTESAPIVRLSKDR